MSIDLSSLSKYQIDRFFLSNPSVTQESCNREAERITGQPVNPTPSQGGSSYTVECGPLVVQFRTPSSTLDMGLLSRIELAYGGFVPRHEHRGKFGDVLVYVMSNVGGVCVYMARGQLQSNDYQLLRVTLSDYARFFASAYHNTPRNIARPDPAHLLDQYTSQLQLLRQALPERFHAHLDDTIPKLPDLFAAEWPLVPSHTDLFENNIHVDAHTGAITGICDWREAEVSPFGMALGWAEVMLGTFVTSGDCWRYHAAHQELREHFWARFYGELGGSCDEDRRRLETARVVGLFLAHSFDGEKPVVEGNDNLGFLWAALQHGVASPTQATPPQTSEL